jgi:hypothetical protein
MHAQASHVRVSTGESYPGLHADGRFLCVLGLHSLVG